MAAGGKPSGWAAWMTPALLQTKYTSPAAGGKPSGWAAWRQKGGGTPSKFVGVVGRESKKASGKQGMHHHPMMSELGRNVSGGLKPGGAMKVKF